MEYEYESTAHQDQLNPFEGYKLNVLVVLYWQVSKCLYIEKTVSPLS